MSQEKQHSNHFWSGFSLGMLAGGAILYAVATKKGRATMKKVLDNTETLEENIEDILNLLQKDKLLNNEKENE